MRQQSRSFVRGWTLCIGVNVSSPDEVKNPQQRPRRKSTDKNAFLLDVLRKVTAEAFLPTELPLLVGGRLEDARRIVRKASIRWIAQKFAFPSQVQQSRRRKTISPPQEPSSALSRLNCSSVFPPLLLSDPLLPTTNLHELRQLIQEAYDRGQPWPRLLDCLVASAALTWSAAAGFVEKIVGFRIDRGDITVIKEARRFWELYEEGRSRAHALQYMKEMPVWSGDWAYFDEEELAQLLPGSVLPDHHRRSEYLTNYVTVAGAEGLDLFTIQGQSLCRHLFAPYADFRLPPKHRRSITIDV